MYTCGFLGKLILVMWLDDWISAPCVITLVYHTRLRLIETNQKYTHKHVQYIHAFITARLDYCSTLYAGLPALHLGCLERVILTAARFIGGIPRTGHVSAYMLDVLTGYLSSTGSYSIFPPWSRGAFWALLRCRSRHGL